jgi:hypothetical protein
MSTSIEACLLIILVYHNWIAITRELIKEMNFIEGKSEKNASAGRKQGIGGCGPEGDRS